jgi:hypothetical protein
MGESYKEIQNMNLYGAEHHMDPLYMSLTTYSHLFCEITYCSQFSHCYITYGMIQ